MTEFTKEQIEVYRKHLANLDQATGMAALNRHEHGAIIASVEEFSKLLDMLEPEEVPDAPTAKRTKRGHRGVGPSTVKEDVEAEK